MKRSYYITCDEMYVVGKLGVRVIIQSDTAIRFWDVVVGDYAPIDMVPECELHLKYKLDGTIVLCKIDKFAYCREMVLEIGKLQSLIVDDSGEVLFIDSVDTRLNSFLSASKNPLVRKWEGRVACFANKFHSIYDHLPQYDPTTAEYGCWYSLIDGISQIINLCTPFIVFTDSQPNEFNIMKSIACVEGMWFGVQDDLAHWFYGTGEVLIDIGNFSVERVLPEEFDVLVCTTKIQQTTRIKTGQSMNIVDTPVSVYIPCDDDHIPQVHVYGKLRHHIDFGIWYSLLFNSDAKSYMVRDEIEARIDKYIVRNTVITDVLRNWVGRIHREVGITLDALVKRFSGYTGKYIDCKKVSPHGVLVIETSIEPYIMIGCSVSTSEIKEMITEAERYLKRREYKSDKPN